MEPRMKEWNRRWTQINADEKILNAENAKAQRSAEKVFSLWVVFFSLIFSSRASLRFLCALSELCVDLFCFSCLFAAILFQTSERSFFIRVSSVFNPWPLFLFLCLSVAFQKSSQNNKLLRICYAEPQRYAEERFLNDLPLVRLFCNHASSTGTS